MTQEEKLLLSGAIAERDARYKKTLAQIQACLDRQEYIMNNFIPDHANDRIVHKTTGMKICRWELFDDERLEKYFPLENFIRNKDE